VGPSRSICLFDSDGGRKRATSRRSGSRRNLDPIADVNADELEKRKMNQIWVSVVQQQLSLIRDGAAERVYSISTAANGVGSEANSFRTPRGLHRVRLKIGDGCPSQAVFVRRRPTGEVFSQKLRERWPERDWILSRILWLDGLEVGLNRGGSVDTLRRHIYIHVNRPGFCRHL
jgi:hypothetical protein